MKSVLMLLMMTTIGVKSTELNSQEGVYVLDSGNFGQFLKEGNEALVFFHGKDCSHCEMVRSMWKQLLKEWITDYPKFRFGLAESESDETLKKEQDIVQTPQLRLYFNSGFFAFYEDEFTPSGLRAFVDYHLLTQARPTRVDSDRTYVRFSNRANAILLAFPQLGPTEDEFALGLQRVVPDVPVYLTQTDSKYASMSFPADSSQSTHKMRMKRSFDDGDKFFGTLGFEPRHLLQLVWPYRKSRIELFSGRSIKDIFTLHKQAVIFFDEEYETDNAEVFSKAVLTKGFDGLALKSKLNEEGAEKLRGLFGVRRADFPTVRALRWENGKLLKYMIQDSFSRVTFEEFLENFAKNSLTPYRKNQKVENEPGAKIWILNSDLFNSLSADSTKHFVYALVGKQAAIHDSLLRQTYPLLRNPDHFVIGIIDVNLNELDNINRKKIPLLQVLTRQQRHRPLTYDGPLLPEAFAEYLNDSIDVDGDL